MLFTGKKLVFALFSIVSVFIVLSCATVIYGSKQDVPITSKPGTATVEVYRLKDNVLVHTGTTPAVLALPRSSGYFKPAEYRVVIKKDGFADSEHIILSDKRLGWYVAGNLPFGGIIGWVVIDPLTGAFYELLPNEVHAELTPQ